MTRNPVGFVSPIDGGNPRIVPARAISVISGGDLVHISGAADNVSSGLNSFKPTTDLLVESTGASGAKFNGVALQTTASGGDVAIVTRGMVIARAAGTVVNGEPVGTGGAHAFIPLASVSGSNIPVMVTQAIKIKCGRAWSNATSGNYALIELTP